MNWVITPEGRRHWATIEPGSDATLVLRIDEQVRGTILLRKRGGGGSHRYPADEPARLHPNQAFGEGIWDVFLVDAFRRTRRVQAAWIDPRVSASTLAGGRLRVLSPYRTVLGAMSIRSHDRSQHFELRAVSVSSDSVLLTGALTSPSSDKPASIELEGIERTVGQSAGVPVVAKVESDGALQLAMSLEEIRLSERAASTTLRPWLITTDQTRISIGALLSTDQAFRRLRAGIQVEVDDPAAIDGLAEESPDPGRTVHFSIDLDRSARLRIGHTMTRGSE